MATARTSLRTRLSVTTALVGGVIGIATPAGAQLPNMPTPSLGVTIAVDGTPVLPGDMVPGTGTQLDVTLGAQRSIIGWDSFSIGAGKTVNFNYAGADGGAVLNRVTRVDPTNFSDIAGNITVNNVLDGATAPLAVYLINPNGILFGGGAAVNVGALIASTLDQTAADDLTFLAGVTDLGRLTGATGAVQVLGNARLSGTTGEVVLLGATVAPATTVALETGATTTVSAATDAAFIVGSDVTITRTAGSPLAFTIDSGTPVSANLVSAGTVNGRNVMLAIASRDTFTDALLVSGAVTATGVEMSDRGVVLTAGVSAPGVSVTAGTGTSGAATLTQSAGTITSGKALVAAAQGAASLTGTVDVDGTDYTVSGATVALGGTQAATGIVSITAATAITGAADLRLTSNKNGTAADTNANQLQLTTTAAAAAIDFDVASVLTAGTAANRTNIVVNQATLIDTLAFGDIFASVFASAAADTPSSATAGAIRDGALRFGNVDVLGNFTLTSNTGSVTSGAITANLVSLTAPTGSVITNGQPLSGTTGIIVQSQNDLALSQLASTAGGVLVNATAGDTIVAGPVTAGAGEYSVLGNSVTLGTAGIPIAQTATGAVTITARGAGTITGLNDLVLTANSNGDTDAAAEALTIAPGTGGIAFGTNTVVNGGSAHQSDVLVGADGPLTLGSVNARQLRTSDTDAAITRAGTITAGTLDLENALDLSATALSLGQITVRGAGQGLTLATTTGALNATGPLSAGGAISATSSAGGVITLGDIVASTSVLVQSSAAVTTGSIASSGTVTLRGATVSTGALGTDTTAIGGDVVLETLAGDLTAPEILSAGSVTLTASANAIVPTRIIAGGTYNVTGNAVRLGDDADAETQSAGGAVTITARTGNITGGAALTLQSGQGATSDLTLTAQAPNTGFVFDAGSIVNAGTAGARGNLILATNNEVGPVTFGNVRAGALQSRIGAAAAANGVSRSGSIVFGAVDLNGGTLALTSIAGDVTVTTATVTGAGNGIVLTANGGTVNATTLTATGTVALFGNTVFNVGALTSIAGDVTANSNGATTVASASARAGNVSIRGGTDASVTTADGVDIAVEAAGGAATATTLTARDDIAVRATTAITGGTWTSGATVAGLDPIEFAGLADTLVGTPVIGNGIDARAPIVALATATTGASSAALAGDLLLTATVGRLELGSASVGRNALLTKQGATDQLVVTGTLSVGTANAADPAVLGNATIVSTTAATLNTITATGDLDASTTAGALTLTSGSARDILLRTANDPVTAITLTARDDIVIRPGGAGIVTGTSWTSGATVGTLNAVEATGVADAVLAPGALAGNDIDVAAAGISIATTRAIGAGSDIRLAGPLTLPNADTDFSANADGDVLLGAVIGRDVFIRGGNAVSTGTIDARDDVVVEAGIGGLALGNVVSGATVLGQGAIDTEGGIGPFEGSDIQLTSTGTLRFGTLTSADDIRIVAAGGGGGVRIGDPLLDLIVTAPGAISLTGFAVGRDIALSGASIATGNLSARDDIVLRATTTITTAAQISGTTIAGNAPIETGAGGVADVLNGAGLIVGHDILNRANRVVVASAVTGEADSDVQLTALTDRLQLGDAQAVGNVSLLKQGGTDDLVVTGTLVAGSGSNADAIVDVNSFTNIRLNTANALANATPGLVRDVRISAAGAATGLAIAPDAIDGRPAPGFDRMTLIAGRDAQVSAGGLVQIATIVAGRDATVTAGAGTAEVAGAVTAERDYRVTGAAVRLGTTAPGTVRQQANGVVRIVSTGGAIDGVGQLTLVANQDDTGVGAESLTLDATGGGIAFGAGTTLLGGATNRASNVGIRLATAGSSLTLGSVQARSLRETDAAGTSFGSLNTDGAINFLGDVSVRAGLQITTSGAITARAITVTGFAGGLQPLVLTGASITAGGTLAAQGNVSLTTTAGSLALTTTPGLLGAISNGGGVTLTVSGGDATGNGLRAAGSIAETVSGADTIAFAEAGVTGTLLGEADTNPDGVVVPPAGSDPLPPPSLPPVPGTQDVAIDAGSLNRASVTAVRDISIRTTGNQTVATIGAGRDVALNALGGIIAANQVTAGDDIAARAAGGAITGIGWTAQGASDAAGVADFLAGVALPGSDIDASGTSIGLATATASGAGSDLRLTATVGRLELGSGTAGATATLLKQGAGDELVLVNLLTSGVSNPDADTVITSSTAARLNTVTAITGNIAVAAATELTGLVGINDRRAILTAQGPTKNITVDAGTLARLGAVTAGQDVRVTVTGLIDVTAVTARDIALASTGGGIVAPTLTARDDIAIRATGAVTGTTWLAGNTADATGFADTLAGPLAGNDIDAVGSSLVLGSGSAIGAGSDLRLTATAARLELGTGSAGQDAVLTKQGGVDQLVLVTQLTAGRDATFASETSAVLNTVRAGRDLSVTAGTAAFPGSITLVDGGATDIALNAGFGGITAATLAARDDIAIRASGAVTGTAWTSGTTVDGVGPLDQAGVADALLAPVDLTGNDIDVAGDTVTIGDATANGAGSDVRIAGLVTGGATGGDLALNAGGDITLTADATARDVALNAGGAISTAAITAQDDIAIRAGGAITTAALTSGVVPVDVAGVADALVGAGVDLTGQDIDVEGASLLTTSATAAGTGSDLRLVTTLGRLELDTGTADGVAIFDKRGETDELVLTGTLTAGPPLPGVTTAITLRSATALRLNTVVARGGSIDIGLNDPADPLNPPSGELTGIGADGAILTALDPNADVIVQVGRLARIADVQGGRDVLVSVVQFGGSTGLLDVFNGVAGRDLLLVAGGASQVRARTLVAGDDIGVRANLSIAGLDWRSGTGDEDGVVDTTLAGTGFDFVGSDIDAEASVIFLGTARAQGAGSDIRLAGAIRGGTADGDLDLGADGAVLLDGDAAGRDVALRAGGAIDTRGINARDDIALRAATLTTTTIASGQTVSGMGPVDALGAADALVGSELAGNDIDGAAGTVLLGDAIATGTGSDLRVTATTGRLQLATGDAGGFVQLTKLGASNTLTATALTGGRVDSADVTVVSDTSVKIGTALASRDLGVTARLGDLSLGIGSARDIALNATAGNIATTTLTARDDIAIRATGAVTGSSWTSGTTVNGVGSVDEVGVADALLPGISLAGNDIDVGGSAITIDSAVALGAGSDVRLRGPVSSFGNGANDLIINTGGDIALNDAALGRDVALSAGGAITATAVTARDDIALRAGGAIAVDALVSGAAIGALGAVDVAGSADALLGTALPGNDIDATAASFVATTATANGAGSDLRVTAASGALALGEGRAGGFVALAKQGTADALTATTLVAGLAGDADLTATSATAATIGNATAARDIAISTLAGALALEVGAARDIALSATGGTLAATTLIARDDIVVRGTASLTGTSWSSGVATATDASGLADALAGATLAGNDIDTSAAAITLGSGTAIGAGSDLRLTATAGRLELGTGSAGQDAVLTKQGGTDQLVLVTALTTGRDATFTSDTSATLATVRAGRDLSVAAGTVAFPGSITLTDGGATDIALNAGFGGIAATTLAARDDIAIRASGAVTGTTWTSGTIVDGVAPLDEAGVADTLAGSLTGNDVDAVGSSLVLTTGTATGVGSDLRLTATAGGLELGTGSAGQDAVLTKQGGTDQLVLVTALTTGRDARFTSATSVRLNTVESRAGAITIAATAGEVTGIGVDGRATLTAAGAIGITGGSLVRLGTAIAGSDLGVTADTIDVTAATATNGALSLVADAGNVALGTGAAGTNATLDATGAIAVGTLAAGDAATVRSTGATTIGTVRTTRGALTIDAARITAGTAAAGTTLTAIARGGDLALTTGTAGGAASFDTLGGAGDIVVTTLTAGGPATFASMSDARLGDIVAGGEVRVTAAAGEVTGIDAGAANLRSSNGQVLVTGGTLARLGTVDAGTLIDVSADSIVAGTATARGGLLRLVADTGSVTLGSGSAATSATLTAARAVTVTGTIAANGGNTAITGASAAIGTANAAQALTLNASEGSFTLAAGTAGTTFELNAANEAVIGAGGVTVGGGGRTAVNGAVIRANEVDLGGRLTAGAVLLVNRSAAGSSTATMNLGDFSTATTTIAPVGGFDLSAAEINLLAAPEIAFAQTFGGVARNVQIGTLPLAATTGSARIEILSTGRIDLYGTISEASGAASVGRSLRIGGTNAGTALTGGVAAIGTPVEGDRATLLVGTATTTAGARILLTGTSTIDLRANRIAFGLASGFLDSSNLALAGSGTGLDFQQVADRYISQPTSSLYNSTAPLGTPALAYADGSNLLTATTLTVRYGDYALFQNTSQPVRANPNTGVTVGSFLSLASQGPTSGQGNPNGLALFGIINGLTGSSAALQGQAVIQTSGINPGNTRINGCLIGSGGGGCLISAVTTPVLNIFDEARANIFRTADDLAVQFDPVVGTNNESLFSDLGTIDFQFDEQKCDPAIDSTCAKDTGTDQ